MVLDAKKKIELVVDITNHTHILFAQKDIACFQQNIESKQTLMTYKKEVHNTSTKR